MNTRPGTIENESEVVKSLRLRGYFSSGVPRTGSDARRAIPKKEKARESAWRPTRDQIRYMSPDEFNRFMDDKV